MSEIVGIDLGTTNSLIGIMDAGFPILLADEKGLRLTPSVVYFQKPVNRSSATQLIGCASWSRPAPSTRSSD
jgi:molecular chaperone DnaK (HSP70)